MERTWRPLGLVLISYTTLVVGLFLVCSAVAGLKPTLWGFAVLHFGCALGVPVLWWHEERGWSGTKLPGEGQLPTLLSGLPTPRPSLKEEELNALAARAEVLTGRVRKVYPLVEWEDIYKIVWMVLVEIACEEGVQGKEAKKDTRVA